VRLCVRPLSERRAFYCVDSFPFPRLPPVLSRTVYLRMMPPCLMTRENEEEISVAVEAKAPLNDREQAGRQAADLFIYSVHRCCSVLSCPVMWR